MVAVRSVVSLGGVALCASLLSCERTAPTKPGAVLLEHDLIADSDPKRCALKPEVAGRLKSATTAEHEARVSVGPKGSEVIVHFTTAVDPQTGGAYLTKVRVEVGANSAYELSAGMAGCTNAGSIERPKTALPIGMVFAESTWSGSSGGSVRCTFYGDGVHDCGP